jgi:hypothetical protein
MRPIEWVRILDVTDPHFRRLGLVMRKDGDWLEVWIGDHDPDFRHRVRRDKTEAATGTMHPTRRGAWFVTDRKAN